MNTTGIFSNSSRVITKYTQTGGSFKTYAAKKVRELFFYLLHIYFSVGHDLLSATQNESIDAIVVCELQCYTSHRQLKNAMGPELFFSSIKLNIYFP